MEDELCPTGYGVADIPAATYEEVTRADSPIDPMPFPRAGPLMQFPLHGYIRFKLHLLIRREQLFKFFLAGSFCVGSNYSYEPTVFFH